MQRQFTTGVHFLPVALILFFLAAAATADNRVPAPSKAELPSIALIIDDLGNKWEQGKRAVKLPGPVACAFLPHGPHTSSLARMAHKQHKEVMLHLPMQAMVNTSGRQDAGILTLDMTQHQFEETLSRNLAAVPHVVGLNNHRGSLLTRHPGHMVWLMGALTRYGELFFVDSRTTSASVANTIAGEYGIPSTERNVFLDHVPDADAVRAEFRRLLGIARRDGTALGIAHPSQDTLDVLTQELEALEYKGIKLIPVAQLIARQNRRTTPWQASLSR